MSLDLNLCPKKCSSVIFPSENSCQMIPIRFGNSILPCTFKMRQMLERLSSVVVIQVLKNTFILHLHIIEYTSWSTLIVFWHSLRNQMNTCKSKAIVFSGHGCLALFLLSVSGLNKRAACRHVILPEFFGSRTSAVEQLRLNCFR